MDGAPPHANGENKLNRPSLCFLSAPPSFLSLKQTTEAIEAALAESDVGGNSTSVKVAAPHAPVSSLGRRQVPPINPHSASGFEDPLPHLGVLGETFEVQAIKKERLRACPWAL